MRLRLHRIVCTNICEFVDLELNLSSGCNRISSIGASDTDINIADIVKIILIGRSLDPYDIELLRPKKKEIKDGFAEINIDIDNERCSIRIDIDYIAKRSRYRLTTGKDDVRSVSELPRKYRISEDLLEFISPTKKHIDDLFDRNNNTAELMIESVTGLDKVKYIGERAEEISVEETLKYGRPSSANKGINRQNSLLNKYRLIEMKLEEYRNELHTSLVTIKSEQNKMIGRMGFLVRKIALGQLNEIRETRNEEFTNYEVFDEVIVSLKYPPFFSQPLFNSIHELHRNLGDIKYPVNSVPSILRNITTTQFCICGNEIDDNMRENINRTYDRFSLNDPYLIINNVKKSLDDFKNSPLFNYFLVKSEMEASKRELSSIRQNKPTKSKIIEATVLPDINMIAQTILDLDKQAENIGYDFLYLTDMSYNNDPQSNIPACRQKIRDISLGLENADLAEEFRSKTELFSEMMSGIYSETLGETIDKVIRNVNTKLSTLLGGDVIVEDIGPHIMLNTDSLNDHQRSICGLIFIQCVLENSGIDLPFMINGVFDDDRSSTEMLGTLMAQSIMFPPNNDNGGW